MTPPYDDQNTEDAKQSRLPAGGALAHPSESVETAAPGPRVRLATCGYEPEQGRGEPDYAFNRYWIHLAVFSAQGDRAILRDYLLHLAGMIIVARIVQGSDMPGWAYLVSAYGGMSILKIRTYLEHRAHDLARCRTVIIDGGVILPFLFLNNNLHVVHHAKPNVAWYKLPALYRANRDEYLRRNEGYRYASYAEVFRRYFLKAKDPVPHPNMRAR